jgi:hypothetical protein
MLEHVIKTATSDRFATGVLNYCGPNKHRGLRNWTGINKEKLEAAFCERMKSRYGHGGSFSFFPGGGETNVAPLCRWAMCGTAGRKGAYGYLMREFRLRPANIGTFVHQFFPREDNDASQHPEAMDALAAIEVCFPVKELAKLLDEYGDAAIGTEEEARSVREFTTRSRK